MASLLKKPKTLDELVETSVATDFHMRNVSADIKPGTSSPTTSVPDPYAMDIDASRTSPSGKTREEFMKAMRGRCFGCGQKGHSKRDGGHAGITCRYCARLGHYEHVCQDKYMGFERNRGNQPSRQRAAATIQDSNFTLFPGEPVATIAATTPFAPIPTPAQTSAAGLEAIVAKQNEILSAFTKILAAPTTAGPSPF